MKYLIDSNVFLEVVLERQHAQQARDFFDTVPTSEVAVADFSLHAMGFYIVPKRPELYVELVQDIITRGIAVLRLPPEHLASVATIAHDQKLDFEDAFVYAVAQLNALRIVSFDSDFDHTARGRVIPRAAPLVE